MTTRPLSSSERLELELSILATMGRMNGRKCRTCTGVARMVDMSLVLTHDAGCPRLETIDPERLSDRTETYSMPRREEPGEGVGG